MDIREIIRNSRAYNFHAHTQFCDGHDTMAAIARAAVEAGMTHFGFSPHSPISIPSPCNMAEADIPAFRAAMACLADSLGSHIKLYTGMEIDYLGPQHCAASEPFASLPLDYTISSVHFIPNQEGRYVDVDGRFESFARKMEADFHSDIRYVVETFYAQSEQMLAMGGFDILGHFDKIALNASYYQPGIEDEGWYKTLIDKYIDHIIESGVIVEINTKSRVEHGRFFPHHRYWPRLIKAGVDLMVNSDAHYAARVEASRAEAFEILKSMGYDR